ncbi:hypothetical protein [Mycobacterium sp. Root135]|uniref:hypothetical protein n=1 Tax=Mycobacterium sp. Root135 TaxID=1736457 RepID=UPI001F23B39C|nr:hypothetical protein [Mycobacterium sp. Root135]
MNGLAKRLTTPDLGAVGRSLVGVILAAVAGLQWGSAGAATAGRPPVRRRSREPLRCKIVHAGRWSW